KDLLPQLNKLSQAIDGGQFAAGLTLIDQELAKNSDRACLWAYRTLLLRATGQGEEAQKAADEFLSRFPDNPIALAEKAIMTAITDSGLAALEWLEKSLGKEVPDSFEAVAGVKLQTYGRQVQAMAVVSEILLQEGHAPAALTLIGNLVRLTGDAEWQQRFSSMLVNPSIPLIQRRCHGLPADVLTTEELPEPVKLARALILLTCWQRALSLLEACRRDNPADYVAFRLYVRLLILLGRYDEAVRLLESPGDVPTAGHEDALAAELAAARESLEVPFGDVETTGTLEFPVADVDGVMERLASDRRLRRLELPPEERDPDSPPPLVQYEFGSPLQDLSKESLEKAASTPFFTAQLYGKETDRDARLIAQPVFASEKDAVAAVVCEWLGDTVEPTAVEFDTPMSRSAAEALRVTFAYRMAVMQQSSEIGDKDPSDVVLAYLREVWLDRPQAVLGGKSMRESLGDESLAIQREALWQLAAYSTASVLHAEIVEAMREELGCPTPTTIDATKEGRIDPLWLDHVDPKTIPDDIFLTVLAQATSARDVVAMRRLFPEFTARRDRLPASPDEIMRFYAGAAPLTDFPSVFRQRVEEGMAYAAEKGVSDGMLNIVEVVHLLSHGKMEQVPEKLQHIGTVHNNEREVMAQLMQIMYQLGLIDAQGRPVAMQQPPAGADPLASVPETPSAAPQDTGGLWTPDSAKPQGGGKLWMPGDD
ncbi:MAG: tetratricopeptide repeat protein, partial [Planctomycetota bacterium]